MVQAKQTTMGKLLSGPEQLRVPLFQRHYRWGPHQWEDLWNDVARLTKERAETDTAASHFLGSIVVARPPRGAKGLLVVDGQQRLITIGVLLCALRDSDVEMGARSVHRIERALFLPHPVGGVIYRRLRVLPSDSYRESYARVVAGESPSPGADVSRCYTYFKRRILELAVDEAEADEDFTGVSGADIVRVVLAALECVLITAGPDDNAHRIFQSLNNTGLPLTQADLIRNYVFMRLDEKKDDFYEFVWRPLEDPRRFNADEFTQLFWLDLILDGHDVTQRQTYVHQEKSMQGMTASGIRTHIEDISARAELWDIILHPYLETSGRIKKRLQRMDAWGTTTAAPTLMYLMEQRAQGQASWGEVERAMLYLESYFVRRVVIGRATMNMNRVLMSAPSRLRQHGGSVDVALRAHLTDEGKHWATDSELREAAGDQAFYKHGRAHQRSLVLRWIEESLHSHEDTLDPTLTVEHVMPQKLTNPWRQELKRGRKPGDTIAKLHGDLLHTIGNLTLVSASTNPPLSNNSFTTKKKMLDQLGTGIQMTQEITDQPHWGPVEIRARSKVMIERIIENWPGPLRA